MGESVDEVAARLAELLSFSVDRCKVALSRCEQNEESATDYLLTHEEESVQFWEERNVKAREEERVAVAFERWGETFVNATDETLSEIIATCLATGESEFTDDSFPASDASLFFNPGFARTTWRCHDCNRRNPMPSESELESYRRSNPTEDDIRQFFQYIATVNPMMARTLQSNPSAAVRMMASTMGNNGSSPPSQLVCGHCQGKFPMGLLESIPTEWRRPKDVRDEITMQYGTGSPWKLVRDSVKPEDVRQGAVGNCWFVGALSILAQQRPELINQLFPYNTFDAKGCDASPFGVYLVRLCKDGLWRSVIIDDQLPCNRNGGLVYTNAARRQLWVPLIEKAAAKLSQCYEGMHSGTLCEAFSLLTGFATDRVLLSKKEPIDADILWARIESAHTSRFLIGLACSAKPGETTPEELHSLGLQAPHAFVVLNTREVNLNGTYHRLLHLGNPWGDRSPSTWKGPWDNASVELAQAVREKKLPRSLHDVKSNGDFWISWNNVQKYFASLEFCRTNTEELKFEKRIRGWLPAATGLGDSFHLVTGESITGKVTVDISLYQKSHAVRESAQGGLSTNIDLGFAVLDQRKQEAVVCHARQFQPEVSEEIMLDANASYWIVPLSFCHAFVTEHRKVVACVRATGEDRIVKFDRSETQPEILRAATHEYIRQFMSQEEISKELFPGLHYAVAQDKCGALVFAENRTGCIPVEISVDADDSVGIGSTRAASGGLIVRDIVMPRSCQVLMVLTPKPGSTKYTLSISVAARRSMEETKVSHFPIIEDHADDTTMSPILSLHAPLIVAASLIVPLATLVGRTTDPAGVMVMMRLLQKQQQEIQRMYLEYVAAGIDAAEAMQISRDEAHALFN